MSKRLIYVDSFEAVSDKAKSRKATYHEFREGVIAAGRYSVFEATENARLAGLFDALERDPEVITSDAPGFPWRSVRRATKPDGVREEPAR